jgi:aryl-alcohol dehydrogenase-like predicted oxidoreductase
MEMRPLGRTGLRVSVWSLGAMAFGSLGTETPAECGRIIGAALDAGINSIDTADVYSHGQSEQIVGEALAGRRDEVVLATKCFWPMGKDPNHRGLSRRWVMMAVEASLRRLRTEWLDILYLHKPDPNTEIEDTLAAASDLVRQGKVRVVGTSSFPAEQLVEAQSAAERCRLVRPRVEEPSYSILARAIEADVLPACSRWGMGVMAAAPLNGGWLTAKHQSGRPADPASRASRWRDGAFDPKRPSAGRKHGLVTALEQVAAQAGCSLTALSMAFAVEHPAVTSAIVGPRTLEQLRGLLPLADIRLDGDTLDRIDALVPPGTDVEALDRWYHPPALAVDARRRSSCGLAVR